VRGHLLGERASVVRSTVTTAAIRGFLDGAKVAVGSALAKLERNVVSARGMIIERFMAWSTIAKRGDLWKEYVGASMAHPPMDFLFTHRFDIVSSARKRTNKYLVGPAGSVIGSRIGNNRTIRGVAG